MKAPFPWFGGKSRVAHQVWQRFGDVPNYVEPFAGSLAVLLTRPDGAGKNETVNDKDAYLSNFWRALQADPEKVAHYADWPVNEADLHSRHKWLVEQSEFRERMLSDPDFYDVKIAGWWVWGISLWIGSGWCVRPEWQGRSSVIDSHQRGIHNLPQKRVHLKRGGCGVHRQLPVLGGDGSGSGRGVHAKYAANLEGYLTTLAERLRRVKVCCGDWTRVLGPSPTVHIGVTGVFLDPPYGVQDRSDVYSEESRELSSSVRQWAIEHGDDPRLRIALCGYEGEHDMPDSWECVAWKSGGGYGGQSNGQGRKNAERERIWFSPHCLRPQEKLF